MPPLAFVGLVVSWLGCVSVQSEEKKNHKYKKCIVPNEVMLVQYRMKSYGSCSACACTFERQTISTVELGNNSPNTPAPARTPEWHLHI
ncbi:hypothetical protein B0I72DRAFT_135126 [Yarrowia lipolytica]|uniref:Secreted protein n=1 Tax=Yarrowia lipolytica TaxID=4952 RepID=A0A371C645_YARLL|nr:hypothetical protein BKA91DRAFT_141690 [Yarrowia lipolytica]KAE8169302.1 hypothetical protein BKA90DRAFT_142836 [Yarrowia lipolytica]RDW25500.1 hypothetical protein B0I71DRAFT_132512 [Yarrowia lipolytica]RDW34225.1 hypothetical protein B0I72DRAFT_135126 [Yarrowia lipolytica]RDW37336.1 hypothetical protein B0I73DRAFT_135667 [Yarrowia lipolytica]